MAETSQTMMSSASLQTAACHRKNIKDEYKYLVCPVPPQIWLWLYPVHIVLTTFYNKLLFTVPLTTLFNLFTLRCSVLPCSHHCILYTFWHNEALRQTQHSKKKKASLAGEHNTTDITWGSSLVDFTFIPWVRFWLRLVPIIPIFLTVVFLLLWMAWVHLCLTLNGELSTQLFVCDYVHQEVVCKEACEDTHAFSSVFVCRKACKDTHAFNSVYWNSLSYSDLPCKPDQQITVYLLWRETAK